MLAIDTVKPADLPRAADGKMDKVIFAFDIDGTLVRNGSPDRQHGTVNDGDVPIVHQINTLMVLSTYKNIKIVVWSGGGKQYAEMWGKRLGLDQYVWRYASKLEHDDIKKHCDHLIAIDDIQATRLGDVNLIVREK
jgi:hydroxymethylpyrimidine pyrophosphatase-like HAD family hydrolase